jgi:hypothetical protein
MDILTNIKNIKNRVTKACNHVNRNPEEVEIIAVSKTISPEAIKIAIDNGIKHIGENRVQEAWEKYQVLGKTVRWHLIGHLQTNKVKKALQMFDIIHSVDSKHLAEEINKRALQHQKSVDVLVEVNTSAEETKFGCQPDEIIPLLKKIAPLPALNVCGLMTIGAFLPDPEDVRPCFRLLRQKLEESNQKIEGVALKYLSMGMTNDFEVAIEEGANMIRIGRAIFKERGK